MILKYYTWNKVAKTWDDTKAYCSICSTKSVDRTMLTEEIHRILSKRNLISLPRTCLSLIDRSEPYIASYHLFAAIAGKNINFGKLEQIPNKLSGFSKKENPFANTAAYFEHQPIRGRGGPRFIVDEIFFPVEPAVAPVPRAVPAVPLADWEPRPIAYRNGQNAIGRMAEQAQRIVQQQNVPARQVQGDLLDIYEEDEPF
jgi:hypothetical protein